MKSDILYRLMDATEALKNRLDDTKLLRYDAHFYFRISEGPDGKTNIYRRDTVKVKNLTHIDQPYRSQMDVLEDDVPSFYPLTIKTGATEYKIQPENLEIPCDRPHVRRFGVSGLTISGDREFNVEWAYDLADSEVENGWTVVTLGSLIMGLSIQAEYDESKFNVSVFSRNNPAEIDGHNWTFGDDQLWLPEQHFQVLWSRKEAQ